MTAPHTAEAPAANAFAAQLRALRERAGLTQEELAEKAGLTSYAVSALERGRRQRPYPHTVRCLADALDTTDEQRAALMRAVPRRSASAAVDGPPARPQPVVRVPAQRVVHLPAAATPLLGRDDELAALREVVLSGRQRLLTLTGTGGVGKTRLATALAEQLADAFPDGTAVVSLAPLSDASAVLPATARAVGCPSVEGPDAERLLAEHLAPLRFLLVLDNVEHLLGSAHQVAALVAACPRLVVLVTSRAPLRVRGEAEYAVQPLAVPQRVGSPDELAACPAVAVFLDRARAVSPGFEVTDDNAAAVAELCRRLAGIPLALELAAARVRFLSAQALLGRLDDAMARAGGPDLPERQRTMRATFDWSYDLLDAQEQALLRQLSVFSGGCTLEAVEEVSAALGVAEPVLPLLEVLVEHSLVVVNVDAQGAPRFGLLEPVAQYARNRQDDDERRRLRAAHAACYLALAERAAPEFLAGDQVAWLDRAEQEDANLVSAVTWAVATGDGDTAGRLCWALWLFWRLRSRLVVGRRLTEEGLQLDMRPEVRVIATNAAGCMAFAAGDLAAAGAHWRETERLAVLGGETFNRASGIGGVGLVALAAGDLDTAERQLVQALPHTHDQGVYGDWLASLMHVWLGTVQRARGDLATAAETMRVGLDAARRRGDRLTAYVALFSLAQVETARGQHAVARGHVHEGVRLSQETGDLAYLVCFLQELAVVEGATGQHSRAAVLRGAADAVREHAGAQIAGYYRPDEELRDTSAARTCEVLGQDAYDDAVDAGRNLTPEEAVAYVLTGAPA